IALWAQNETVDEDSLPRVSLGQADANPGDSFMIPVYFTPDPKRPLRSFEAEIDFVSNNLKFQKATGSPIGDAGGIVESTLTEGTPDAKNVTRSKALVTISLPEKTQQGLPEGLVAYLLFQVSTQAKPFAIKLNTSVISAQDLKGEKVT